MIRGRDNEKKVDMRSPTSSIINLQPFVSSTLNITTFIGQFMNRKDFLTNIVFYDISRVIACCCPLVLF